MPAPLPPAPDLQHLKKQAKDLLKARAAGDPEALATLREHLPRVARDDDASITLHGVQTVIARHYGFVSWADLRATVGEIESVKPSQTRAPSFDSLADKLRRHIDTFGFHSVCAYRRWCHEQGFGIKPRQERRRPLRGAGTSSAGATEARAATRLSSHRGAQDHPGVPRRDQRRLGGVPGTLRRRRRSRGALRPSPAADPLPEVQAHRGNRPCGSWRAITRNGYGRWKTGSRRAATRGS